MTRHLHDVNDQLVDILILKSVFLPERGGLGAKPGEWARKRIDWSKLIGPLDRLS